MKTNKQPELCKNCKQPIFMYDGEWFHNIGADEEGAEQGDNKCVNLPSDKFAEPIKKNR